MSDAHSHAIAIVDFGSQYTQLIARRIRELGVYSIILSPEVSSTELDNLAPAGIILSGGPDSVGHKSISKPLLDRAVPILGVCYGMQLMAYYFGGVVEQSSIKEFGYASLQIANNNDIFSNVADNADVWMSHGDKVTSLPQDFEVLASTDDCPIAAMRHKTKPFFGLQFHPEVTHTQGGESILRAFVLDVCNAQANWIMADIITHLENIVHDQVGSDKVVLGLSGGVDSSVVAALLHRVIGKQLECIFVDNGLLRLDEGEQVMETFAHLGVKVHHIQAQQQFLKALKGIEDPEQKRKIIGNIFIDIFDQQAQKIGGVKYLAQGTIYPDVIESAASKSGKAHTIKSHHNVGGLPERMKLKLVEPLRELFKDEVRRLGVALGLPQEMINRHPFPGPGLGVRILGEVTKEYADILRQADAIFLQTLHEFDWYDKCAQAFAVFLPIKSVGVVGDQRRYAHVIALRAVETTDFMTAHAAHLPQELLDKASRHIVNEIEEISRVVYDISSKPPATIEWE